MQRVRIRQQHPAPRRTRIMSWEPDNVHIKLHPHRVGEDVFLIGEVWIDVGSVKNVVVFQHPILFPTSSRATQALETWMKSREAKQLFETEVKLLSV